MVWLEGGWAGSHLQGVDGLVGGGGQGLLVDRHGQEVGDGQEDWYN